MCHSSGTAAPEGRHEYFLLKACGFCFDVERCLLAFKDAMPCGPPWCDPTEDEKPKLRSWVARAKHLRLNSHKRKVQRIRIALLPRMLFSILALQQRSIALHWHTQCVICNTSLSQKSLGNGADSCKQIENAWIQDRGDTSMTMASTLHMLFSTFYSRR